MVFDVQVNGKAATDKWMLSLKLEKDVSLALSEKE